MSRESGRAWRAMALAGVITGGLAVARVFAQEPSPLGEVTVLSGPTSCDRQDCYRISVRCPQLAQPARATLKVGTPLGKASRGTILFTSGLEGTGLWDNFGRSAARSIKKLRKAGYRTVQIQWEGGWMIGAPGKLEGFARLACRPATVARWVYDTMHDRGPGAALCATGNSAGSSQISYMLTDYGFADILSAVVLSAGPPFSRVDLGCIRDDPSRKDLWYEPRQWKFVDAAYGFSRSETGPCGRADATFIPQFQQASGAYGERSFNYPKTMVWFVHGAKDDNVAVPQAQLYHDALEEAGSPLVRMDIVPKTPHATPSTRRGAKMILNILLDECHPR